MAEGSGGGLVAGPLVAGYLEAVGVVAGSFDDSRVGPVAVLRVEVLLAADVGLDCCEDVFPLLRGKGRRHGGRCGLCG
jgi:hypothetical protein